MKKLKLLFLLAFVAMSMGVCAQNGGYFKNSSYYESEFKLLNKPNVKEYAKRVGDTLILTFNDGSCEKIVNTKKLQTSPNDDGVEEVPMGENGKRDSSFECSITALNSVLENGNFFVVSTQFLVVFNNYNDTMPRADGGKKNVLYSKVNKSFKKSFCNNPLFSPDKNQFAFFWEAGPCEEGTAQISIYDSKSCTNLLFVSPSNWNPTNLKWVSNTEIKITRSNAETGKPMAPLTYKFNGTKWVLAKAQGAKPAGKK